MTDDNSDEIDMAHRARLRAEQERDALALELRRLRAAEAPGTDDGAFEGTGWFHSERWTGWCHESGRSLYRMTDGYRVTDHGPTRYPCALDAMRAAVPGSV